MGKLIRHFKLEPKPSKGFGHLPHPVRLNTCTWMNTVCVSPTALGSGCLICKCFTIEPYWTVLNLRRLAEKSERSQNMSEQSRPPWAWHRVANSCDTDLILESGDVWRRLEMSGVKARVLVWDWSLDCTTYPGLSGLRLGGHCGWTLTMVRVLHGFTVSHIFLNYTINIRCMYSRGEDMISISLNGGSSYLLYGKSPPSPICTQFGISFWSEASTTQRVHSCCVLLFCINYDSYSYMLYDVIWCYIRVIWI